MYTIHFLVVITVANRILPCKYNAIILSVNDGNGLSTSWEEMLDFKTTQQARVQESDCFEIDTVPAELCMQVSTHKSDRSTVALSEGLLNLALERCMPVLATTISVRNDWPCHVHCLHTAALQLTIISCDACW